MDSVGSHPNFRTYTTVSLATSDPFRSSQAKISCLYIHSERVIFLPVGLPTVSSLILIPLLKEHVSSI